MISNLLKKKNPFPFQFDCCNIFCFRFMATRTRGRNQKKYWKETVIVIKWTAFHEYCNDSLWSSFTLILHNRKRTEKGGGEKLEQVFLFCFCFCVADYCRYNLYFIVCSNHAMSERLLSGRFTKEQSFSGADNFKNTNSSISDHLSVTDVMTQLMS